MATEVCHRASSQHPWRPSSNRHILQVSTAQPPGNINFHNLGTPWPTTLFRRMITLCVALLLLLVTFAVMFLAKQNASAFSSTPLGECSTDIMAGAFGTYVTSDGSLPRLYRNEFVHPPPPPIALLLVYHVHILPPRLFRDPTFHLLCGYGYRWCCLPAEPLTRNVGLRTTLSGTPTPTLMPSGPLKTGRALEQTTRAEGPVFPARLHDRRPVTGWRAWTPLGKTRGTSATTRRTRRVRAWDATVGSAWKMSWTSMAGLKESGRYVNRFASTQLLRVPGVAHMKPGCHHFQLMAAEAGGPCFEFFISWFMGQVCPGC